MENNLIYTTRSRQDLDDIWDYISFDLQNLPSAERILNRIMDAVPGKRCIAFFRSSAGS